MMRRKRRPHKAVLAVVIGGSMAFSGLYWNVLSDSLGSRLSHVYPRFTPQRASAFIDAFGSLWSFIGLVVVMLTLTRLLTRSKRGRRL